MYYCTFVKIENSHNRLRDDVIDGMCGELPTSGKQFFMYAEPRDTKDPEAKRYINTSVVQSVTKTEEGYLFKTESGSTYLLKNVVKAKGDEGSEIH